MRKEIFAALITITIACILVIIFLIISNPPNRGVIKVPRHFKTIQSAIDAAKPGDVIFISSGVYEERLIINKSLTLIGENSKDTIISGGFLPRPVILVEASNFNIKNLTICKSHITSYGIVVYRSSNVSIVGNIVVENHRGIYIYSSDNVKVIDNLVANNTGAGIELRYSCNVTLKNNKVFGNRYNLGVWGLSPSHFIHDIDTSNLVNGKTTYYWVDEANKTVPRNAGYLGLVRCVNITVEDMTFSNNGQGVLLAYTNNSVIKNVNALDNWEGIGLVYSFNNIVCNNNASFNMQGLHLHRSWYNNVSSNVISQNIQDGILLEYSYYNVFNFNIIKENGLGEIGYGGITLQFSFYNTIYNNTFSSNLRGMYIDGSYNTFSFNNISRNIMEGVSLNYATKNVFNSNIIKSNHVGLRVSNSFNNVFSRNSLINNSYQVISESSENLWDDGSLGNYWGDYKERYPDAEEINGSSVWNTPYIIDDRNKDRYPLVKQFIP